MSATKYLEELIYKFLTRRLTDEEKRSLHSGYEADKYIDEETEEEMRQEIFQFVKDRVLWAAILSRLRDEAEPEEEEDTDCDGTSSEEYE